MENFQLNSTDNSEYTLSDTPSFSFNGELVNLLPDFYSEKIIGTEQYRFLKFISQEEGIFNTIYTNIKNFYSALDLNKTHPKYLYLLSKLLGQEVEDLTVSSDEDKIKKQREYLKQTIDRLLIKGSPESIVKFYYGLGIFLDIEELWTYDFNSYTIYVNKFIKEFVVSQIKYNQGVPPNPTNYNYTSIISDGWDIIATVNQSLSGSIGIQNITKINRIEMNNYNYTAILVELSGGRRLFIKDDLNNWIKYDSFSFDVSDIKFYDDKILILQKTSTNPILKIYKFSNILPGKEKKILSDINFFSLIKSGNTDYLLVDAIIGSSSQIQTRNLVDFSISNYINKPFNTPITKILKNKENEWFLFDEIGKLFIFLTKNENNLSFPLLTQSYIDYSTVFSMSGNIYIHKRVTENIITMLLLDPNSSDKKIYRKDFTFSNYIPTITTPVPYITTTVSNLQDIVVLDEKSLLFLGKDGLGIYFYEFLQGYSEIVYAETLGFGDASSHWNFIPTETLSNIYISKTDGLGKYSLLDFKGVYFYGRAVLFKTHYYNLKITKELSLSSDNSILLDIISTNLKNIEMGYSKIRNIKDSNSNILL